MNKKVVLLEYNYGFIWKNKNKLHFKGYIFYQDNLLTIDDLESLLNTITSINEFQIILKSFIGTFSFVFENQDSLYAAVDPTRTFPLFYHAKNESIIITDNTYTSSFKDFKKNLETNQQVLGMRFVLGNKTSLLDVYQIQAGECISFNKYLKSKTYHNFSISPDELHDEIELLPHQFQNVLSNAIKRIIESVSGRTLVVPLSGGYDSRLVLSLLYKENYKNVICFTYGNNDDEEVKISKKVAESLGYKWVLFETTKNYIPNRYLYSNEFENFSKFSYNNVSMIHLQDYLFVKKIHDEKMIPDDAIFLPGHTGDVVAGNHLYDYDDTIITRSKYINQIIKRHFVLKEYTKNMAIEDVLKEYYDLNKLPHSLIDNFNVKERQAKFIVNSLRNYEFFGYEHRIVLWDQEVSNFLRNLPFKLKLNSNFYKTQIFNNYFNELKIDYIPKSKTNNLAFFMKKIKPYIPQVFINKLRSKSIRPENFSNFTYKNLLHEMNKELGVSFTNSSKLIAGWLIKK